ncbi:hypothetical protein [Amycolatopsis suaedae]|uniref:Uncharacterized protein n=1 Tax=Amycolatopsis suaedae TaxID=2510978 RepID=A0A4Q7J9C2_9PSEU|nr:hypothetical protein [Amycolatopsis suaedae]RZQ63526.1 hypothetical protein EWH70_13965 [Amycolatopsis suaedae]
MRYLLALLLTLLGSGGLVLGMFRSWREDRSASDFALRDVFTQSPTTTEAGFFTSVAVLLLAAVVVGLFGALVRSRVLLGLATLAALVPTGLWALQAADGTFEIPGLRDGFTNAAAGAGLLLLATVVTALRRRRAAEPAAETEPAPGTPRPWNEAR